jgi:hypothetical protein
LVGASWEKLLAFSNISKMKGNSVDFKCIPEIHKKEFLEHGYCAIEQIEIHWNSILNTKWRLQNKDGIICYAKVYYGYGRSLNKILGKKDVLLALYFKQYLGSLSYVEPPKLIDHWESESEYFTVFEWVNLDHNSSNRTHLFMDIFAKFLRKLEIVPYPDFWSDEFEPQNYACQSRKAVNKGELAPFSFDLEDNIHIILPSGKLYFYDYEHIQWANKGLQATYICLKRLLFSPKVLLFSFFKNSDTKLLCMHLDKKQRRKLIGQTSQALTKELKNTG